MTAIIENIKLIKQSNKEYNFTLVAVSKTKPDEDIRTAFEGGHLDFGENKVQELVDKHEKLPKEIRWHMIGHLQRNKVKYIADFVYLIHGVDTEKLLNQINKEGKKVNRVIPCLLQVHIAQEESKFGFSESEVLDLMKSERLSQYSNVVVKGLMGMATNTSDTAQVRQEFGQLKSLFETLKSYKIDNLSIDTLSMGMSGDYKIALEEGSNMIRVGSAIFGARNYG